MINLWGTSRSIWRAIVPPSLRDTVLARQLKRLYHKAFRVVPHDAVYDADYFQREVEDWAVRSADPIASSILADLKPSSVVDVGCGTGALLAVFKDRGCRVLGLEYAESGLEYCRKRNLDVRKFDIERASMPDDPTFDVAVSLEVAEHLPESVADRFVELLAGLSDRVVFTAAHPGQTGTDHVNEQPASYWIAKFGDRGFTPDVDLASRWKEDWESSGQVASYYIENLLIFRRRV
jgi:SAM-dependent methyltransferase